MVKFFHNLSFIYNRFYFLLSDELVLPHDLHCVESAGILFANQNDPGEGSTSYNLYLLKVMPGHFLRITRLCKS